MIIKSTKMRVRKQKHTQLYENKKNLYKIFEKSIIIKIHVIIEYVTMLKWIKVICT